MYIQCARVALRTLAAGFLLSALAVGLTSPTTAAQACEWLPGDGVPGTDELVFASTMWDPDGPGPQAELLVVGGLFKVAGNVPANHIAAWDGNTWLPLASGMSGASYVAVNALTVHDGALIAAGRFESAGGVACSNIARWDGSSWQPLGAGIYGWPDALTVYNGDLIVGGWILAAGGVLVHHIARWDGSEWHALGSGTSQEVDSLTVYNGELVVGGSFYLAGGVLCNNIARWTLEGGWQPLGSGVNDHPVRAVAVYDGELIASGGFTAAGGVPCDGIARWSAENGWQALPPGHGGAYALAVWDGMLAVGADATWDGTAWHPLGSDPPWAWALTVFKGDLIVGGSFGTAGGVACSNVARWNGNKWHALGREFANGNIGTLYAMTLYPPDTGELIIAGAFQRFEGVACRSITRWDGTDWRPLGSGIGGTGPYVYALTIYNDELIAGGYFSMAGSLPCSKIARWNGTDWQPLGLGMDGGPTQVSALTVYRGDLIAGGFFNSAGGVPCNSIAKWNPQGIPWGHEWKPLGSGMEWIVSALTVYNDDLIAGGEFLTAGGLECNHIARWDGDAWHPMASGMDDDVRALIVCEDELIAGGAFTTAGGVPCDRIARWTAEGGWQPLGSGIAGQGSRVSVYAMMIYEGDLLVGGEFETAGGVECNGIARWDGNEWHPLGNGIGGTGIGVYDPRVAATTFFPKTGDLIAVGTFTIAGDYVSNLWARWSCGIPGDLDGDGYVTLDDFAIFAICLAGPGVTDPPPDCDPVDFAKADMDDDLDVDAADVVLFQAALME